MTAHDAQFLKRSLCCLLIVALLVLSVFVELRPEEPAYRPKPLLSERKKHMANPKGHPDMFARYHADIRGYSEGDRYPMNYQIAQYQKAKATMKHPNFHFGFNELGPGNVGGRTRPIVVDPDDSSHQTWYAGSISGGLWKTTNAGDHWVSLTDDLPNLSVSCLAQAESDHDIMYMGTGEGFYTLANIAGGGIFKSADRGNTWTQLTATTTSRQFRFVYRLAIDPKDPDIVVAATNTGIYRSEDGGTTWAESYNSGTANGIRGEITVLVQDLKAQPGNFNVMLATANGDAILRSVDAGRTWTRAYQDFYDGAGRMEIAWSPSHPSIAYVSVEGNISDLFRTDDAGASWQATFDSARINWLDSQGWYDQTLAVHPWNPDVIFVGGIDLWTISLGDQQQEVAGPTGFDFEAASDFMDFSPLVFGTHMRGLVMVGTNQSSIFDVTLQDLVSVAIRFGQSTQKAHAFTVAENAGELGEGGEGVSLSEYRFSDYVEVPFQVWDTDNNRQLMVSFRDQADDGTWNLIRKHVERGPRDSQSREYLFIHKYDYAEDSHPRIGKQGGVAQGMLFTLWPVLPADTAVQWDPLNLPASNVTITVGKATARERIVEATIDAARDVHVDHHAIDVIPIDEAAGEFWIVNANDGGVAFSMDGGQTFVEKDAAGAGFNTSQFYGVSKKPGERIYVGGTQDNSSWVSGPNPTGQQAWTEVGEGDGFHAVWHATDPNKVLVSAQYNFIFRSTDGGQNFLQAPHVPDFPPFITVLGYSDLDPDRVFAIGRSGVWRSNDFAESWVLSPITEQWASWTLFDNPWGQVKPSRAHRDIVWAGFRMTPSQAVQVSTDGGLTFKPTSRPDFSPDGTLSGLSTHPLEDSTAYALFSRLSRPKILRTTDLGKTWRDLSGFAGSFTGVSTNGFPDVAVYDLHVFADAPYIVWAATDIGIFESQDHGTTWHFSPHGLPAVSVFQLHVRDREIVAATHGRGIWAMSLGEVVASEDAYANVPSGFSLDQNYPNPFNTTTSITFAIPHKSHMRLAVFDVAGRKVATLVDQVYAPGKHRVNWDASVMASGVYFYRLESDGFLVQTRKMALVK